MTKRAHAAICAIVPAPTLPGGTIARTSKMPPRLR
jgi:hypothetical protein